ncbi:helix-turn-helix domain-containing protein [Spirosoma terrae]|uniref:Helix-turn-helix transcriptional regulator n=1 Tax=Spirosoma terrae TaxID=1968276 RepID=A0A6L9L9Y8_9BACT|nr:helix-turn-helix transcriptional regulator [Spirosoma terrae]
MQQINSISQFHQLLSLPESLHPLVSVVRVEDIKLNPTTDWEHFFLNFYTVSLKRNVQAKARYGQQYYDFDTGVMSFTAPRQLQSHVMVDQDSQQEVGRGYVLLVHPDFLLKSSVLEKINQYGFFAYALHEALHLSAREEADMLEIFRKIDQECQHIDQHTQDIILSQIDLLLSYSNRFYGRQFVTRKAANKDLLANLERVLEAYFEKGLGLESGHVSVDYVASQLHVSPSYLSDVLRSLTGQNARQHIQEKILEKARFYLAATNLSVAEIAYQLGFEHPQSFNKFFRKKNNTSPLAFRRMYN